VSDPRISIVLPTRNGGATLPSLLDALQRQRIDVPYEVIALDSGSTDGSVELLRRRADRVISIACDTFDHGLTRNLGIEQARGDLIVLLVQDAVPVSDGWLAALTAPLFADDGLAGAYARQVPRPDASPVTRYYLGRYLASSEISRTIAVESRAEFEALTPEERLERCTFDNVCSCIRRSVWARHPFREATIGEDVEWARDVLLSGHRLGYVADAVVIHSHDRPATYEFMRTYVLHRRLYELFGLRTIPNVQLLTRAIASSLRVHRGCEPGRRPSLLPDRRSVALAFAWPLGQYLGALAAVTGWGPSRFRTV
jgi:rhamnosyltransferase